jgi:molecular chaperone GrpE
MQDQDVNILDQLAEAEIAEAIQEENVEMKREAKEEKKAAEAIQALIDEAIAEQRNQFLRLSADFSNYKKRVEKEKLDGMKYANEKIIVEMLTVVDNLERAISHSEDAANEEALLSGIKMVHKSLMEILKKQGLEAIPTEGQPFDHFLHHAVMTEHSDEVEVDTIIQEFQKGYTLNTKVIRPSMVKVASKE